jgi:hypothetical protein
MFYAIHQLFVLRPRAARLRAGFAFLKTRLALKGREKKFERTGGRELGWRKA